MTEVFWHRVDVFELDHLCQNTGVAAGCDNAQILSDNATCTKELERLGDFAAWLHCHRRVGENFATFYTLALLVALSDLKSFK